MKKLITFSILLSLTLEIFSQDDSAVQIMGSSRFDFIGLKNFDSKNYALFHGEADLAASISTENLKLFKGGEFFVQGMAIFGNKSSQNYTHDIQVFSNIESDTRLFLYQCYYKQILGKLIVKIGQLDLNAEYSVSGYGSSLVNSSFGIMPTVSLNMPSSIFSYLTAGASFKYLVSSRLTLQTAFFNGEPGDYQTNRHNLKWDFGRENGWMNISEFHFKTKNNVKQGKYKAGLFYHSKVFTDLTETTTSKGDFGFFVMGDQQLTSEKNTIKNGLSFFFELSYCPSSVNYIGSFYSLGLIYRGIFSGMNEDELTMAVASAGLGDYTVRHSPMFYSNETALEITYKKYITPSFIIQPDFQHIIHPGADRQVTGNVNILLLRTIMAF